jgi:hypothetical protein
VSVFPGENYRAPRSWTERAYQKLIYFNEADQGGHYAAWEQPELFSQEVRGPQTTAQIDTQEVRSQGVRQGIVSGQR